ncbi:MAG: MBL fold metallo-hydrolase, partial [Fervidobacterium pennivorans]
LTEVKVKKLFISPEDSRCLYEPSENLSVLFDEHFSMNIQWYNIDEYFNTIPAPGHTEGSRIITFDGYIFTGDVVFSNTVGRADLYYDQSKRKTMKIEMV